MLLELPRWQQRRQVTGQRPMALPGSRRQSQRTSNHHHVEKRSPSLTARKINLETESPVGGESCFCHARNSNNMIISQGSQEEGDLHSLINSNNVNYLQKDSKIYINSTVPTIMNIRYALTPKTGNFYFISYTRSFNTYFRRVKTPFMYQMHNYILSSSSLPSYRSESNDKSARRGKEARREENPTSKLITSH